MAKAACRPGRQELAEDMQTSLLMRPASGELRCATRCDCDCDSDRIHRTQDRAKSLTLTYSTTRARQWDRQTAYLIYDCI